MTWSNLLATLDSYPTALWVALGIVSCVLFGCLVVLIRIEAWERRRYDEATAAQQADEREDEPMEAA